MTLFQMHYYASTIPPIAKRNLIPRTCFLTEDWSEQGELKKKVSPSVCGTAVSNETDNVDSHKTGSLKAC